MGIPSRLLRVVKSYVNSWLGRSLRDFESGEIPWPDEEEGATSDSAGHHRPERPLDARLQRCYSRLELPAGSDLATVRRAWKEMMMRYHPDRYGNEPEKIETATRLCQELTEAYLELSRYLKETAS